MKCPESRKSCVSCGILNDQFHSISAYIIGERFADKDRQVAPYISNCKKCKRNWAKNLNEKTSHISQLPSIDITSTSD